MERHSKRPAPPLPRPLTGPATHAPRYPGPLPAPDSPRFNIQASIQPRQNVACLAYAPLAPTHHDQPQYQACPCARVAPTQHNQECQTSDIRLPVIEIAQSRKGPGHVSVHITYSNTYSNAAVSMGGVAWFMTQHCKLRFYLV